jgi:hypothetical protein
MIITAVVIMFFEHVRFDFNGVLCNVFYHIIHQLIHQGL